MKSIVAALFLLVALTNITSATTVSIRFDGLGTGTVRPCPCVAPIEFTDRPFTVTASYDTANVTQGFGFNSVQLHNAAVAISGFNTAIFPQTYLVANWNPSFNPTISFEMFTGGSDGVFVHTPLATGYALTTPLGPIFDAAPGGVGIGGVAPGVGQVSINARNVTFQATIVPEPSTLAMLLAALPLAYLAYRRRCTEPPTC